MALSGTVNKKNGYDKATKWSHGPRLYFGGNSSPMSRATRVLPVLYSAGTVYRGEHHGSSSSSSSEENRYAKVQTNMRTCVCRMAIVVFYLLQCLRQGRRLLFFSEFVEHVTDTLRACRRHLEIVWLTTLAHEKWSTDVESLIRATQAIRHWSNQQEYDPFLIDRLNAKWKMDNPNGVDDTNRHIPLHLPDVHKYILQQIHKHKDAHADTDAKNSSHTPKPRELPERLKLAQVNEPMEALRLFVFTNSLVFVESHLQHFGNLPKNVSDIIMWYAATPKGLTNMKKELNDTERDAIRTTPQCVTGGTYAIMSAGADFTWVNAISLGSSKQDTLTMNQTTGRLRPNQDGSISVIIPPLVMDHVDEHDTYPRHYTERKKTYTKKKMIQQPPDIIKKNNLSHRDNTISKLVGDLDKNASNVDGSIQQRIDNIMKIVFTA